MRGIAAALGFLALFSTVTAGEPLQTIGSVEEFVTRFKLPDNKINQVEMCRTLGIATNFFQEPPSNNLVTTNIGGVKWKILKLSDGLLCSWQYLFFRMEKPPQWRYVGKIGFKNQQSVEPAMLSRTIGRFSWVLFENITTEGTGVFESRMDWFRLGQEFGKLDLSYVSRSCNVEEKSGSNYVTECRNTGLSTRKTNGLPAVTVSHKTTRNKVNGDNSLTFLSEKQTRTHFAWSTNSNRFVVIGNFQSGASLH
jgi:hypothetical protein